MQSLQPHLQPAGDHRSHPCHGGQRQRRQSRPAARHLSRLSRTHRAQHAGWSRAGDGALGHAQPALCAEGEKTDPGVTNIRNTKSPHWLRWLGIENRCVVPFTSFSEFDHTPGADGKKKGDTWFALDESRPLAVFAGIHVTGWTSTRKVKEGEVTADLYGFLTCEPNAEVGAIHPKAMPVILTDPVEIETWLTAPWDEAANLQRPLPDGTLTIVGVGQKKDEAA